MGPEDLIYHLPESLIAQEPPPERGGSRLLVASRDGSAPIRAMFSDIGRHLPPGALLVVNDAKVTPARLLGRVDGSGAKIELLILDPPVSGGPGPRDVWCLGKPGRRLGIGARLILTGRNPETQSLKEVRGLTGEDGFKGSGELTRGDNFKGSGGLTGEDYLEGEVIEVEPGGAKRLVRLRFKEPPAAVLERLGRMPLPPYIKRPDRAEDRDRYQTVYASSPGAVAAPTAGLHFTEALLNELKASGFKLAAVTLRVGFGTFATLTEENLSQGRLHDEDAGVSQTVVKAVNEAKGEGRAVVAVGTTTARALEWASLSGSLAPRRGACSLFIRPGHEFKTVDALITNFHLPGSSLMLLVAALMGPERLLAAYELAVRERYRFYSYGDAMLIL